MLRLLGDSVAKQAGANALRITREDPPLSPQELDKVDNDGHPQTLGRLDASVFSNRPSPVYSCTQDAFSAAAHKEAIMVPLPDRILETHSKVLLTI